MRIRRVFKIVASNVLSTWYHWRAYYWKRIEFRWGENQK